jgi:hypothetical protein
MKFRHFNNNQLRLDTPAYLLHFFYTGNGFRAYCIPKFLKKKKVKYDKVNNLLIETSSSTGYCIEFSLED